MVYEIRFKGIFRQPRVPIGDEGELPQNYEAELVPSPDDTRPVVTLFFEVLDGVPQCREVRVTRSGHGREVRRVDFAGIPVETLLEAATKEVSQPYDLSEHEHDGEVRLVINVDNSNLDNFLKDVRRVRRTSYRRGPTDAQLRAALKVYESAERAPTQAVAAHFGIKHRTASLWIKRARELGTES